MRRSLVSMLFLLFATGLGVAGDLNGRWEGKVKTPDGHDLEIAFNFKVEADKLTGTAETTMGTQPIIDGQVKGDDISFKVELHDTTITNLGKLSGDTLNMKSLGPWGEIEFSLARPKAKKVK